MAPAIQTKPPYAWFFNEAAAQYSAETVAMLRKLAASNDAFEAKKALIALLGQKISGAGSLVDSVRDTLIFKGLLTSDYPKAPQSSGNAGRNMAAFTTYEASLLQSCWDLSPDALKFLIAVGEDGKPDPALQFSVGDGTYAAPMPGSRQVQEAAGLAQGQAYAARQNAFMDAGRKSGAIAPLTADQVRAQGEHERQQLRKELYARASQPSPVQSGPQPKPATPKPSANQLRQEAAGLKQGQEFARQQLEKARQLTEFKKRQGGK